MPNINRKRNYLTAAFLSLNLFNCTIMNEYECDCKTNFSVMTFNIRHRDESPNSTNKDKYPWNIRSPIIIDTILKESPDILALQEVNEKSAINSISEHDSVQSLLLDELRTNNEYHVYMNSNDKTLFTNDCINQNKYDLTTIAPKAIFYKKNKFKCLSSGTIKLPGEYISNQKVNRYASWVILQDVLNETTKYFVINAHLAAGDNETIRIESTHLLVDLINSYINRNTTAVILTGDLNSIPNSKPINILKKEANLFDSYNGNKPTINTWGNLHSRVDFILHSNKLNVVDSEVINFEDIPASDHLPLKTIFRLE